MTTESTAFTQKTDCESSGAFMRLADKKKPSSKPNSISYNQKADLESPRRLHVLNMLRGKLIDLDLKNTLLISVQHLCSTTEALFHALLKAKLSPQNLYVIGKCYSTNPDVVRSLGQSGIKVSLSSSTFNNSVPFDVVFERNIEVMLKQILNEVDLYAYEKIIILDDGGHLIEKVNEYFPKNLPMVGIEQTSSGFNRMSHINISFPIINLARSWLKLERESPIIIDLVLRKLHENISYLHSSIENILIMGQGVLGEIIYKALSGKYAVSVYDSNPKKSEIASCDFKKMLSKFDLVLGCTGNTSLFYEDYRFLKRPVVLASISSSDREFEAHRLRKLQPKKNCHKNINVDGISLLNCGFPITFDEDYESIDTDDFQLTRALIFASIYQAFFTNPLLEGFIELRSDLQKYIQEEVDSL